MKTERCGFHFSFLHCSSVLKPCTLLKTTVEEQTRRSSRWAALNDRSTLDELRCICPAGASFATLITQFQSHHSELLCHDEPLSQWRIHTRMKLDWTNELINCDTHSNLE